MTEKQRLNHCFISCIIFADVADACLSGSLVKHFKRGSTGDPKTAKSLRKTQKSAIPIYQNTATVVTNVPDNVIQPHLFSLY